MLPSHKNSIRTLLSAAKAALRKGELAHSRSAGPDIFNRLPKGASLATPGSKLQGASEFSYPSEILRTLSLYIRHQVPKLSTNTAPLLPSSIRNLSVPAAVPQARAYAALGRLWTSSGVAKKGATHGSGDRSAQKLLAQALPRGRIPRGVGSSHHHRQLSTQSYSQHARQLVRLTVGRLLQMRPPVAFLRLVHTMRHQLGHERALAIAAAPAARPQALRGAPAAVAKLPPSFSMRAFSRWNGGGGGGRDWRPGSLVRSVQRYTNLRRPSGVSPEVAVYALMAANAAVFVAWQVLDRTFMYRHFTVSADAIRERRYWTALTYAFSQRDMSHLLTNMLGLFFFGREVAYLFGPQYLVNLYFVGAVAGSLAHFAYFRYIYPAQERARGHSSFYARHTLTPTLVGASASVNAIVLLNCLLNPRSVVYLYFFIPIPQALLGVLFVFKDAVGLLDRESSVGYAAHLGGALVGVLAWLRLR
eukprot:jgi/Mesen1/9476/ME000063S08925